MGKELKRQFTKEEIQLFISEKTLKFTSVQKAAVVNIHRVYVYIISL